MLQILVLAVLQSLTPAAAAFIDDATQRLLAGQELAPDFPVHLQALPPDQRLLVIVHLRRAGYLADVVMPVDWIIAPESGASADLAPAGTVSESAP